MIDLGSVALRESVNLGTVDIESAGLKSGVSLGTIDVPWLIPVDPTSISGAARGTGTGSGSVLAQSLSGAAVGTGTGAGSIDLVQTIAGAANATGTGSGAVDTELAVSGGAAGTGTGSGAVELAQTISGAANGTGTSSGAVEAGLTVSGAAVGTGTGSGAVELVQTIAGSAAGTGTGAGDVTLSQTIAGAAAGSGTGAGAVTVPASVPDAFVSGDWTVVTGSASGEIDIAINTLPSDGGSALTALQYSTDAGSTWAALTGTGTGSRTVSTLSAGGSIAGGQVFTSQVMVRAVNSQGNGPNSDAKSVTAGAAVSGFTFVGANSAEIPTTGATLALPSGVESGDLIVVWRACDFTIQDGGIPGYTNIYNATEPRSQIEYKIAGASEPDPDIPPKSTRRQAAIVQVFRSATAPSFISETLNTGSGSAGSFATPLATQGDLVIALGGQDDTNALASGFDADLNNVITQNAGDATDANSAAVFMGWLEQPITGNASIDSMNFGSVSEQNKTYVVIFR